MKWGGYRSQTAKKKAIIVVAHALLVIIWHVLATGKPYDELGEDYFTNRLDPDRETRRLERLAYPLPATCLAADHPYEEGPRRVRQLSDDTDQLTVKVVGSALLMMRPVPGDRHDRAVPAGQPHRDVSVIVQAGARDISRADDFGTVIIRDPHLCHIHRASSRPLSHPAGYFPYR